MQFADPTITEAYNATQTMKLIKTGKIEKAKEYVLKYFARCSLGEGVFKWDPSSKDVVVLSTKAAKDTYFAKHYSYHQEKKKEEEEEVEFGEESKIKSFSLAKWFFAREIYYKREKPEKPNEEMKRGLKLFWDHVKIVLCSENKILYRYMKNWICSMVAGKKMISYPFLRGGQGSGKSSLFEFIIKYVLGPFISYETKNPNVISATSNYILANKLFVLIDDPTFGSSDNWKQFGMSIKAFISHPFITIKKLYSDAVSMKNISNFACCANTNAVIIEDEDRRAVILDIDERYKGNKEYFDALFYFLDNKQNPEITKTFAKFFYWDCLNRFEQIKEEEWCEYPVPMTNKKREILADNLNSVLSFIKEEYVLPREAINRQTLKDFYDDYKSFCEKNKIPQPFKYNQFAKSISELVAITKNGWIGQYEEC